MTSSLPSPRSGSSTPAKEATIYVPDAMHPLAEKYADERFGRVVRPGDMSEEDCLAVADAMGTLCALSLPYHYAPPLFLYSYLVINEVGCRKAHGSAANSRRSGKAAPAGETTTHNREEWSWVRFY